MPRTIGASAKNYLLFLVALSLIVFILAPAQSSLQSTATLSRTTPLPDTTLVNRVELLLLINSTPYNATTPVELLPLNNRQCLDEAAIYIHGVWTNRMEAIEQAQRIDLSIEQAKINLSLPSDKRIPIFIFIWEGNTIFSPFGRDRAKSNADAAGDKLADIIAESKGICPNDEIRLVAYSLGSRVVLSALDSLENNTRWKHERFNITSVHLMSAAVDDEKISQDQSDIDHSPFDDGKVYRNAIERNVANFTNLYNPEDDMLERVTLDALEQEMDHQPEFYPHFERDDALGSLEIQQASIDEVDIPSNYQEKNVENEIREIEDADADYINEAPFPGCDVVSYMPPFNCTISTGFFGDNHKGYMGFRDPNNSSRIISDGGEEAIDMMIRDWWTQ